MPALAEGRYVPDSPTVLGQRSGPVGTFFVYLALLFAILAPPVFTVVDVVVEGAVNGPALAGAGVTLFLTPLGIHFLRNVATSRKAERRVHAVGVPATAEIVAVTTTSVGDDPGVELTLHVTGEGFPAFTGRVSCLNDDDLRVGTVLNALVDPTDNVFTVVGR